MVMMALLHDDPGEYDMREAVCKHTFEIGISFTAMFREFLDKQSVSQKDIKVVYEEIKCVAKSEFFVEIKGPVAMGEAWFGAVNDWVDSANDYF